MTKKVASYLVKKNITVVGTGETFKAGDIIPASLLASRTRSQIAFLIEEHECIEPMDAVEDKEDDNHTTR